MKLQQELMINKDKCVACKLFSAPLLMIIGTYFGHKNYFIWHETPRMGRYFLVLIPAVLYIGGLANMVIAYRLFTNYKKEEELFNVLKNEGFFNGKD